MSPSRFAPALSAMRPTRSACVHSGLFVSAAMRRSATIAAAAFNPCDHSASAFAGRAYSNAAFAYGRAMVARSATRNLCRQFIQQFGVSLRIDLALQQARRTLDRQLANFPRQALARPGRVSRHLVAGLRDQPLGFARGRALGFLDDFIGALAGLIDDLDCAVARLTDDFLGPRLGLLQITFALARRGQSGCNLFLPL